MGECGTWAPKEFIGLAIETQVLMQLFAAFLRRFIYFDERRII